MNGYKVVRKLDDEYRPITYGAYQGIKYVLGQVTGQDKDKFGPMTVFNSLILAQQFANDMSHLPGVTVFKVKYDLSKEDMLWKIERTTRQTFSLDYCYHGTVLASSVKLEEIVS